MTERTDPAIKHTYDTLRKSADDYSAAVARDLPPDLEASLSDLLLNVENFLVGAYVDAEFKGYWNSDITDGVSTLMTLVELRTAMRKLDIEPPQNGSRPTGEGV